MFDGKLENSELKGCTKLEKIEYIKDQSDRFCSVYDKFCNNNNDRQKINIKERNKEDKKIYTKI